MPLRDETTVDQLLAELRTAPRGALVEIESTEWNKMQSVSALRYVKLQMRRMIKSDPRRYAPANEPPENVVEVPFVMLCTGLVNSAVFCPACGTKLRNEQASDLMR